MAGRRTTEGPSLVEVEGQASADVGECFERNVYQLGDAACAQEVDGIEEGDDDEVGEVETAKQWALSTRTSACAIMVVAEGVDGEGG